MLIGIKTQCAVVILAVFCWGFVGIHQGVLFQQNIIESLEEDTFFLENRLNASKKHGVNLENQLNETMITIGELNTTVEELRSGILSLEDENSQLKDELTLTPPPIVYENISGLDIIDIIYTEFGRTAAIHKLDKYYDLTSKAEIERFLARETEAFSYVTESYDCDDRALRLYGQLSIPGWSGLAIGISSFILPSGSAHMCLVFIDNNHDVYLLDGGLKDVPEGYVLYNLVI